MAPSLTRENSADNTTPAFDSLMHVSCLASRSLDLEKVLPDTLEAVAEMVQADRLVLLQLHESRVTVRASWCRDSNRQAVDRGAQFPKDEFPGIYASYDSVAIEMNGFQVRRELPYLPASEPVFVLRIPLIVDNIVIGRLDVLRDAHKMRITDMECHFAEACAKILSLTLRNGLEYARMAWLADHDALTGLGNRRRFDCALERELARAERYGRDLSLLLIDLDDFKDANTRLGLSGGDEVLRRTGHVLANGARHGVDISCRIGGDEFAMILPEINEHSGVELAQRLVREVEKVTSSLWPVRFSFSITSYPAVSAERLREMADTRLMDAKRKKRQAARTYQPLVQ